MLTQLFKRTPLAFWLSLLFVLLVTFGAFARDYPGLRPPAKFVHPFPGKVIVHRVEPDQVPAVCVRLFGKLTGATLRTFRGALGCTIWPGVDGVCRMVIINRPVVWAHGTVSTKDVYRHELAHCNGWPPDHPEGE